jgi:hypothetical protein
MILPPLLDAAGLAQLLDGLAGLVQTTMRAAGSGMGGMR